MEVVGVYKNKDGSFSNIPYKKYTEPPPEIELPYVRKDTNLFVPNDGHKYVMIKHWKDLPKGSDNVDEYPEIIDKNGGLLLINPVTGRDYDYVELEDRWLWFLWDFWNWGSQYRLPAGKIESYYTRPGNFRTFANTTPGSLTYVYVDLLEAHRCFTDAGSPEAGARDVVTGRNLYSRKNVEFLCRPTGGHLARVKRIVGVYYELEAIDLLGACPTMDYMEKNPHLYFWCTQAGKYTGATRFPQIKNANAVQGLPEAGTPSPFFSIGGSVKILKSSCVEMQPGQPYTPYASP